MWVQDVSPSPLRRDAGCHRVSCVFILISNVFHHVLSSRNLGVFRMASSTRICAIASPLCGHMISVPCHRVDAMRTWTAWDLEALQRTFRSLTTIKNRSIAWYNQQLIGILWERLVCTSHKAIPRNTLRKHCRSLSMGSQLWISISMLTY